MSEEFQPTLLYGADTVKPGVPLGTMIVESSFLPVSGDSPVIASTATKPVMSVPELVMNDLVPLITHSSPSSRAVVRAAPASVPPPGSVSPKAPSISPVTRRGSHSRFCSSVPKR